MVWNQIELLPLGGGGPMVKNGEKWWKMVKIFYGELAKWKENSPFFTIFHHFRIPAPEGHRNLIFSLKQPEKPHLYTSYEAT